jgi:hypothetical protein
MTRIQERFTATGRKLSADEKSAVNALNAKYPSVTAAAAPAKRTVLVKKFSRVRAAPKRTIKVIAGKSLKLEAA